MIDAKELRIGNWVRTVYPINKEPFQVYPMWFKQLPTDKDNNLIVHNWEPIPLTEQWLIDFGFRPFGKDWSKNKIVIHTRKRGFVLRKSVPIIKYVHQLQNLYFALTGEDLQL